MARCILLDTSSVFHKIRTVRILAIIFARFEVFQGFSTCFEISIWNLVYTFSRWCHLSGHFDILYSQREVKVIFLHSWPQKVYGGLRFGTHSCIVSVLTPTDIRHGKAILGPLADKSTRKGELVELTASEKFSELFLYMFWDINLKLGIHLVDSATHWVRVSSQSAQSDLLYSLKWVKVFFLFMASKIT